MRSGGFFPSSFSFRISGFCKTPTLSRTKRTSFLGRARRFWHLRRTFSNCVQSRARRTTRSRPNVSASLPVRVAANCAVFGNQGVRVTRPARDGGLRFDHGYGALATRLNIYEGRVRFSPAKLSASASRPTSVHAHVGLPGRNAFRTGEKSKPLLARCGHTKKRSKLLKFNTIYALDGHFSNGIENSSKTVHFQVIRSRVSYNRLIYC